MALFLIGKKQIGLGGNDMKKNILFFVVLLVVVLSGCFCKDRYFKADLYPVINNWAIRPHVRDIERCSGSDYTHCRIYIGIEQEYINADTSKNMAVRIDSAELVVGNRHYKTINEDKNFKHAWISPWSNKYDPPLGFGRVLDIIDKNFVHDSVAWPLIERDVKEITMTAYVSYMFPEDGRIESKKIEMKLHETIESSLYLWRFFDY